MILKLIRIELSKILPYRPVWIFLGLYFFLLPVIFGFFKNVTTNGIQIDTSKVYGFPDVWSYLTYFASYFQILPCFLIIMIVCNEYTFRTFRQNVIDGLSRWQVVVSKLMLMVVISLLLSFYIFLVGLFFGLRNTVEISFTNVFEKIHFVPLFALQVFSYMTLALIVAVLIKRSALSIILFLLYILAFEKIIQGMVPEDFKLYFPENAFSDLISFPWKMLAMMAGMKIQELTVGMAVGLSIFYCFIFSGISYLILKRRDL